MRQNAPFLGVATKRTIPEYSIRYIMCEIKNFTYEQYNRKETPHKAEKFYFHQCLNFNN